MILSAVLAVLLWVMTAVRLPTLWRGSRQRAFWGALAALAVSRTLALPPIAHPAAQHLTAVVAAAFLLRFVMLATGGRGRRWHRVGTAVVLGLFGAAGAAMVFNPGLLTGALSPAAVTYWVVLDGYLGAVLLTATVLFWTTGAAAPAGLPRVALRLIAVGVGQLGIDAFARAAITVGLAAGARLDLAAIGPTAERLQATSVLLAVGGGIAASVPRARAALSAYGSLLALRPLWTAMRDAFPEIILFSPRRAVIELAGVDDVHLRLYRRVIEIRDGMLALRDFRAAEPAAAGTEAVTEAGPKAVAEAGTHAGAGARTHAGAEARTHAGAGAGDPAVAEARSIALALARRAGGAPPVAEPEPWAPVGPEMADEVAWLRRVSHAYRRLPRTAVTPPAVPTPRPSGSAR